MLSGTVLQVSISRGGVPKRAIAEGEIGPLGLVGDSHAHPEIHGGPRQAVLLITSEAIAELTALGYPLYPGALEKISLRLESIGNSGERASGGEWDRRLSSSRTFELPARH